MCASRARWRIDWPQRALLVVKDERATGRTLTVAHLSTIKTVVDHSASGASKRRSVPCAGKRKRRHAAIKVQAALQDRLETRAHSSPHVTDRQARPTASLFPQRSPSEKRPRGAPLSPAAAFSLAREPLSANDKARFSKTRRFGLSDWRRAVLFPPEVYGMAGEQQKASGFAKSSSSPAPVCSQAAGVASLLLFLLGAAPVHSLALPSLVWLHRAVVRGVNPLPRLISPARASRSGRKHYGVVQVNQADMHLARLTPPSAFTPGSRSGLWAYFLGPATCCHRSPEMKTCCGGFCALAAGSRAPQSSILVFEPSSAPARHAFARG